MLGLMPGEGWAYAGVVVVLCVLTGLALWLNRY